MTDAIELKKRIGFLMEWIRLDEAEKADTIKCCFNCTERAYEEYRKRIGKLVERITRNQKELERISPKPKLTMDVEDDLPSFTTKSPNDPS